jgi:hypothetical protein
MLNHNFSTAYSSFGEAILKNSKIHNLFIQYPNKHILVHWNPFENGDKAHNFFVILIILSSVRS